MRARPSARAAGTARFLISRAAGAPAFIGINGRSRAAEVWLRWVEGGGVRWFCEEGRWNGGLVVQAAEMHGQLGTDEF